MFADWFSNLAPIKGFGELINDALASEITYEKQEAAPIMALTPDREAEKIARENFEKQQTLEGEWVGTNYDPYDVWQNRPDATEENVGLGAAGVRIAENMVAVSRKKGSDEAMLRLGTVLEDPESGERYLVADLMNRRFDGEKKLDFATPKTGKKINENFNRTFSGLRVIREGGGYEDVRNFVESGEWDTIKNGK